jgi:NADH-quinone oxidoreductase subunit F
MPECRLLLRDIDIPDIERIEAYLACGGYRAFGKALAAGEPEQVMAEVKAAGLQNRGGEWYPLAERWAPHLAEGVHYLCVDASEGEPGIYRDRKLIERHPHQIVEGIILAAYALRARVVYVYIREEMHRGRVLLERAVAEAGARGFLGGNILGSGFALDIHLHSGAGGYIPREPTALLRSLEGHRAEPRQGDGGLTLFGRPALVENVGTLAYLPHIVDRGAVWFREMGSERYPGTCVFCVSGHVRRPGLYELEIGGGTLRELIQKFAGGVRAGHELKGVIPGGISSPVLRPEELDVRLSPEEWAVPGGGDFPGAFGGGGVIVMDDTTCMVDTALNLARFYARESCGQCPACGAGTHWLQKVLERVEKGEGRREDLELLGSVSGQIAPLLEPSRTTLCSLGEEFAWSLLGLLRSFGEEFERHVVEGRCPIEKDRRIKVPETVSVRF